MVKNKKKSLVKKKGKNNVKKKGQKKEIFAAGGQAVIEGVLMRSKDDMAIAVRKPDGSISVKKDKIRSLTKKIKPLGWPIVRGVINLFEMLVIGIRALTYSANEALEETEEELTLMQVFISIVLAIGFALLLFKFVPLALTQLLNNLFPLVKNNYVLFNAIDGLIKIILLVAYIYFISFMEDVHRVFMYHGAEHQAVHCYEAGKALTVKNVKEFSPLHPRCGTAFLLFVFIISILVYSFIPQEYGFWLKFAWRLLLLPVIAGVSYEILKLSGKFHDHIFFRIISYPGLLVQRLSTREPDEKQIEVAIKALKSVIGK